ncbi:MAG: metallothionein [Gloeomargarita sp. DG02_4_bins_56]
MIGLDGYQEVPVMVKCDCPPCICQVDPETAIRVGDKVYCSEACAQGHPQGAGCGHEGCPC